MQLTMVVIFGLLAVAVFALLSGMRQRGDEARKLRDRLSVIDQAAARHPSHELALLREEVASSIPALNKLLTKSIQISKVQKWIDQSGFQLLAGKFILMSICVGGVFAVLMMHFSDSWLFAAIGLVMGGAIPGMVVAIKRERRFAAFENMLPDTIDLLTRAVRAGHAYTTALELVATEMQEPIAGEFRRVFDEQKFGLPLRDALLNLTERVPLLDVRILVTAILLQRETGGNLAEILDKLSYVMRERFKILRQVRVYTAQGRMSMYILMALPPGLAFIMSFTSPNSIRLLYTDPLGRSMILAGIVSMTIGYFVIRKIIRIRV